MILITGQRSGLKVIGQDHQDQCHYLKKRSEVKPAMVKIRVQGHKVNVTIRNKLQSSRSRRTSLMVNIIGKCSKEQIFRGGN